MNGIATNKTVITVITTTIAILAFLSVTTICVLAYLQVKIPAELNSLAIGSFGALTGMLVKTSPTESTRQITALDVTSGATPVKGP